LSGSPCTYVRVGQEGFQISPLPEDSDSDFPLTIGDSLRGTPAGEINQNILLVVTRIPRKSTGSTDQSFARWSSHSVGKTSLPFLLNYISPQGRSVTDTFGYSTDPVPEPSEMLDARALTFPLAGHPLMLQNTPFDINDVPNLLQPSTSDDQLLLEYFFSGQDTTGNQQDPYSSLEQDQPWFGNSRSDYWTIRNGLTDDLMYHLHEFCAALPTGHPECAPNLHLSQGLGLIAPSSISRFVDLYFHHWNQHSPIIHRATFDIEKASLPLLFAIILTGALFSSQDDVAKARMLLSLAEEFAFRDKVFGKLLAGSSPSGPDEEGRSFDALQAAFSIAQVQLREGSASTRKHARSIRFGEIIIVCSTNSYALDEESADNDRLQEQ
jgi:hypothetical protein